MLFDFLTYLTGLIAIVFVFFAWQQHRDPFHPMLYIGPMLIYLYSALPVMLTLVQPRQLRGFLDEGDLVYVQTLNLIGTFCLCAGILLGSGPAAAWHRARPDALPPAVARRLAQAALVLGGIGLAAYAYMLGHTGGLDAAYGRAYGGVWADSGSIRDLQLLTVVALLLLFAARTGRRLSAIDWAWVILFVSPLLIHGLLGARRGPTFMATAVLVVGWYLLRGRRPRLLHVLGGGLLLGCLMLFLVENRSHIYLGSDFHFDTNLMPGKASAGNDFVYGAGTILNADHSREYWWGRRYLVVFFVKPVPRFLWPSKYRDASAVLGVPDMEVNLGTGGAAFHSTLGWKGTHGAAPGIVADMWIELWLGAFPVLVAFGWGYGRVWRRAVERGGVWTTVYCLMFALSVYLIMQSLNAMGIRFLETALPAWLAWRYALARGAAAPGSREHAPANRASNRCANMMLRFNPAMRNWLLTFGVSGVNALVGMATGVMAARLLGPAGRGALAALMLWPALIASLVLLSLPTGLALEVARTPPERHSSARKHRRGAGAGPQPRRGCRGLPGPGLPGRRGRAPWLGPGLPRPVSAPALRRSDAARAGSRPTALPAV